MSEAVGPSLITSYGGSEAPMDEHQRRILGRVVNEIEWYRDGHRTMPELLNNAWALFEAAELRDRDERDPFLDAYYTLSTADDLNQIWTAGPGSEEELRAALSGLEEWARALRDEE